MTSIFERSLRGLAFFIVLVGQSATAQDGRGLAEQMLQASVAKDEAKVLALSLQIDSLPKLSRGDRKAARTLNEVGLKAFAEGNFGAAASTLGRALQQDPADVEIANNYGFALLKAKQYPQAKDALFATIAMSPKRSPAWFNLATGYGEQGDQTKSAAAFELAMLFSQNRDRTREYLDKIANDPSSAPALASAAKKALIVAVAPPSEPQQALQATTANPAPSRASSAPESSSTKSVEAEERADVNAEADPKLAAAEKERMEAEQAEASAAQAQKLAEQAAASAAQAQKLIDEAAAEARRGADQQRLLQIAGGSATLCLSFVTVTWLWMRRRKKKVNVADGLNTVVKEPMLQPPKKFALAEPAQREPASASVKEVVQAATRSENKHATKEGSRVATLAAVVVLVVIGLGVLKGASSFLTRVDSTPNGGATSNATPATSSDGSKPVTQQLAAAQVNKQSTPDQLGPILPALKGFRFGQSSSGLPARFKVVPQNATVDAFAELANRRIEKCFQNEELSGSAGDLLRIRSVRLCFDAKQDTLLTFVVAFDQPKPATEQFFALKSAFDELVGTTDEVSKRTGSDGAYFFTWFRGKDGKGKAVSKVELQSTVHGVMYVESQNH